MTRVTGALRGVFIHGMDATERRPGDIDRVEIDEADEVDLWGTLAGYVWSGNRTILTAGKTDRADHRVDTGLYWLA